MYFIQVIASLVFFNLQQCLSLSLYFLTLTFLLRVQANYLMECPSFWVGLFYHDLYSGFVLLARLSQK